MHGYQDSIENACACVSMHGAISLQAWSCMEPLHISWKIVIVISTISMIVSNDYKIELVFVETASTQ